MANENEYTDRTVELTDRHNEKSEVAFFSNAGGHDVLVSYNYMLRVEGMYDLPCKAVHSFTKENEFRLSLLTKQRGKYPRALPFRSTP